MSLNDFANKKLFQEIAINGLRSEYLEERTPINFCSCLAQLKKMDNMIILNHLRRMHYLCDVFLSIFDARLTSICTEDCRDTQKRGDQRKIGLGYFICHGFTSEESFAAQKRKCHLQKRHILLLGAFCYNNRCSWAYLMTGIFTVDSPLNKQLYKTSNTC